MKKIYSLLAMMMIASVTFAQTFTVTVEGKSVNNGDIVTVNKTIEEISQQVGPIVLYDLGAKIELTTNIAQTIYIYGEDLDRSSIGHLACCPTGYTCQVASEDNNYISTCELKNLTAGQVIKGENIVHYSYSTNNPGNITRKAHIKFVGTSETFEFDIIFNVGAATSISNIATSMQNAPVYTIGGVKTDESNIPNGKVFIKGGKKYIKK